MQSRICAWVLSALSLVLPVLPAAADEMPFSSKLTMGTQKSGRLPENVRSALERGDFKSVQTAVRGELKRAGAISFEDTRILHLAMLQELIRETGEEVLSCVASESQEKRAFLAEFAQDAEWLELYLSCGLVPHQVDVGVDVLYRIWREENGQVKNKPLAVALASCWGGGEIWKKPPVQGLLPNKYNPVRRYKFFQRQEERGLLHPNYRNLKPWELRFVVSIPQQDWDDASYEFAAHAINMPWDKYQNACWASVYTGVSKFGDTVQGGAYNLPFADESWAEATLRNGGVCGAMSHLGAVAAMAHGIPAYSVGQPGHCAYAVRPERGKWIGGFGGPDGGMHNYIFGNRAPTSYNLMEAVFADDEKVTRAYRKSFCARALEAIGENEKAEQTWKSALMDAPLHPFFRAALHKLFIASNMTAAQCFEYLSKEMLPEYAGHGVAAMEACKDLAAITAQMPEKDILAIYALQHQALSTTPSSWAIKLDELVQAHADSLKSDDARCQYLEKMFTVHMQQGDGTAFGQLLEWAVKTYVETESGSILFNKAFAKAAESASRGDDLDDESAKERSKKMLAAYGKAIFAAEQARSATAFQALTKGAMAVAGAEYKPVALQTKPDLAGQPARGAMIRISTTSQYDAPAFHAGIMTPEGGRCHTDREACPSFIVELENTSFATGCVIRKMDGGEFRMKKAIVSTSEDGATWFERAQIDAMPKEWVVKFPDGLKAKWIRLEFDNAHPEYAHISHFVTYTR